uniref:Envelope glycoprotein n=1 Tax=Feline immunodeficiency virus TaxID=11673 RepID=B2BWI0_9RETR|nr:envelope glycoprotein [Feline immunodeficiency virus]
MAEGGRVELVERVGEVRPGGQGEQDHEYAIGMNPDFIGPYEGEMLLDYDILQYVTEEGPFRPGHNPFRAPGITDQEKRELCIILQQKLKEIKASMLQGPSNNIPPGKYRRLRYLQYSDMQVMNQLAILFFNLCYLLKNKIGKQVEDIETEQEVKYSFNKREKGRTFNTCGRKVLMGGTVVFYIGLLIWTGFFIHKSLALKIALDPPWVIPLKQMEEIQFQCYGNYSECPVREEIAEWSMPFNWTFKTNFSDTVGLEKYVDQIQAKALLDLIQACQKLGRNRLGIPQFRCYYDRSMRQLSGLEKVRLCPIGGYMLVRKRQGNYTLSMCTEEIGIRLLNYTLSRENYSHSPFDEIIYMGNRYFNKTAANITQVFRNFSIKCDVIVPEATKKVKQFIAYNNDFLGPWGGARYRDILIRFKDWAYVTDPPLDLNCTGIPGIAFNGTEANYTCAQNATIPYGDICTQPEFYMPCKNDNYSVPVMIQCRLHHEYLPNDTYHNASDDNQVMRCRIMKEVDLYFGDENIQLNMTLLKDPFLLHLRGMVNFSCEVKGEFFAYEMKNATWGYTGNDTHGAWNESLNWLVPYRNYTKEMYVWGAYSAVTYNHHVLKDYKLVKKPLYTPIRDNMLPSRRKRGLGITLAIITSTAAGLIGTTTGTSALAVSLKLKEVMLQQSQINSAVLEMLKILQRRLEQSERMILSLHQRVTRIERFLEIQYQLRGMCPYKDICLIPGEGNFTSYNESDTMGRWAEQAEEDWDQFERLLNNATRSNMNLKNDLEKITLDSWLSWAPLGNIFQMILGLIIILTIIVLGKNCIFELMKLVCIRLRGYRQVKEEMVILPEEGNSDSEIELNENGTEEEGKPMVSPGKRESDEDL